MRNEPPRPASALPRLGRSRAWEHPLEPSVEEYLARGRENHPHMGALAPGFGNAFRGMRERDVPRDAVWVTLAAFAYLVLVIQDLATTTVLLRAFPSQVGEANGFMAAILATSGFAGLWAWKLGAGVAVVLVYVGARARFRSVRSRKVTDSGLALSCALQGAVVLSNLGAFVAVA